jgi:hypothetical protein
MASMRRPVNSAAFVADRLLHFVTFPRIFRTRKFMIAQRNLSKNAIPRKVIFEIDAIQRNHYIAFGDGRSQQRCIPADKNQPRGRRRLSDDRYTISNIEAHRRETAMRDFAM